MQIHGRLQLLTIFRKTSDGVRGHIIAGLRIDDLHESVRIIHRAAITNSHHDSIWKGLSGERVLLAGRHSIDERLNELLDRLDHGLLRTEILLQLGQ